MPEALQAVLLKVSVPKSKRVKVTDKNDNLIFTAQDKMLEINDEMGFSEFNAAIWKDDTQKEIYSGASGSEEFLAKLAEVRNWTVNYVRESLGELKPNLDEMFDFSKKLLSTDPLQAIPESFVQFNLFSSPLAVLGQPDISAFTSFISDTPSPVISDADFEMIKAQPEKYALVFLVSYFD